MSTEDAPPVAPKPAIITLGGGIALVTGAGSGIGKDTGFAFAAAGVEGVVFADIDEKAAETAATESHDHKAHPDYQAIHVHVDVTDDASVDAMVAAAENKFGRIDYFVNSAGVIDEKPHPADRISSDSFAKMMNVNVTGTMRCTRAVATVMKKQPIAKYTAGRHGERDLGRGCIVNIASTASFAAGFPGMTGYTASKHAIMGLTKAAAMEFTSKGIRVNAVCPLWVDTPMSRHAFAKHPTAGKIAKERSPFERFAQADEVSGCIVFLCSPFASYINGSGLVIDAGMLTQPLPGGRMGETPKKTTPSA